LGCLEYRDIILAAINAKWIHPSLALRLLKANLGSLESSCEIIEFALRQPLCEKIEPLLDASPRILGISVSIWNHLATIELLEELEKKWRDLPIEKPVVVFGGPEVSHLPPDSEIFRYADYVIRGEGEIAFRELCEKLLVMPQCYAQKYDSRNKLQFINAVPADPADINSAYHFYTDEDISGKLIYVEASRGCLFNCEFCLSSVTGNKVREFPLDQFLSEMDVLVKRGVKTFKFLDRSFNTNIKRAIKIIEFFLEKIEERKGEIPLIVHFEMVPSLFPPELREALARFPPGSLRLEIGIQTLNTETAALIGRPSNPEKELEALRFLREKTNAVIHVDLIAGLPGENLESFGRGFDRLWEAAGGEQRYAQTEKEKRIEIQLGILKLLLGAPISRYNEKFAMRYNPLPPYEIEETSSVSAADLQRIKNFARFWELIVNRGLLSFSDNAPVFERFMALSDSLLAHFGRNWGIDKEELRVKTFLFL